MKAIVKNKEITPHIIWKALLFMAALGILSLALFGCNPVKRVINNPKHYANVRDIVISNGECVNDTLVISKSDTLITFDTIYSEVMPQHNPMPFIPTMPDGFETMPYTIADKKTIIKTVTKTVKIRDTVTKVITDNSRIDLLQKKLIAKDSELYLKAEQLKQSQAETKAFKQARNKWMLYFWIVVSAVGIYLFRKPLLRLISPIKL